MDGDRVKIERLVDSSNWMQWKFQVRALLDARDALEVIDGSFTKPEEGAENYAIELTRWRKANKTAKEILATTLDRKPLSLIMNCETAREMWVKLLDVYEQRSADSIYLLQTQFREYRHTPGDDIATHVSKLESFSRRLRELGEPVSDTMLMTTILNTLPSQYRHFHSAWDSTPSSERTLEKLIARLMVEETRLGIADMKLSDETALVAKKSFSRKKDAGHDKWDGKRRPGSSGTSKATGCWTCGGPHLRHNCPKFRKTSANKLSNNRQGMALLNTRTENTQVCTSDWIIDSGCSEHVCWQLECFSSFESLKETITFELGDGRKVSAEGTGHIRIKSHVDGREHHLSNVMYVPDMKANLFSVRSVAEKGFKQTIEGTKWLFLKEKQLIVEGHRKNDMYVLDIEVIKNKECSFIARGHKENSIQIWHERMGHQNKSHVKELLTAKGIEVSKQSNTSELCDGCSFGKFQRTNFGTMPKATRPGELVVSDVCGPMDEPSLSGFRYFVTFKDDFTQYRRVYFMRHKSEVKEYLEQYLEYVRTQTGNTVKTLLSDNGGEYTDHEVIEYLKKNGVEIGRSAAYTPQQNGRAERENRTLVEMARTMMLTRGVPRRFWAEAINCAAYILNRTGKSREVGRTPYEAWYGRECSLQHLRIFGSECFVQIPKQRRDDKKFGKTSKRGIFVGYQEITGN